MDLFFSPSFCPLWSIYWRINLDTIKCRVIITKWFLLFIITCCLLYSFFFFSKRQTTLYQSSHHGVSERRTLCFWNCNVFYFSKLIAFKIKYNFHLLLLNWVIFGDAKSFRLLNKIVFPLDAIINFFIMKNFNLIQKWSVVQWTTIDLSYQE